MIAIVLEILYLSRNFTVQEGTKPLFQNSKSVQVLYQNVTSVYSRLSAPNGFLDSHQKIMISSLAYSPHLLKH